MPWCSTECGGIYIYYMLLNIIYFHMLICCHIFEKRGTNVKIFKTCWFVGTGLECLRMQVGRWSDYRCSHDCHWRFGEDVGHPCCCQRSRSQAQFRGAQRWSSSLGMNSADFPAQLFVVRCLILSGNGMLARHVGSGSLDVPRIISRFWGAKEIWHLQRTPVPLAWLVPWYRGWADHPWAGTIPDSQQR